MERWAKKGNWRTTRYPTGKSLSMGVPQLCKLFEQIVRNLRSHLRAPRRPADGEKLADVFHGDDAYQLGTVNDGDRMAIALLEF